MTKGKLSRKKTLPMARSAGFYQARIGDSMVWQIRCGHCQTVSEHPGWPPNMNVEIMIKKMRQAGWAVDFGETPLCPRCAHPHKTFPKQQEEVVMAEPTPAPPAHGNGSGSGPDPKLMRAIMRMLEDNFDEGAKRYVNGYSDDRIARETGVHIDLVTKTRRGAFGELAEDPEIIKFKEDLSAAHDFLKDLNMRFEQFVAQRKMGGR